MRASVAAERSGIPSVTVHCTGFASSAVSTADGAGIANIPVAEYPGQLQTHSDDMIRKNVDEVLLDRIVTALTTSGKENDAAVAGSREPAPREIVFKGGYHEVNAHFLENLWSDGLPIVPPTLEEVDEFMRYTDRAPDEVIGVLPPAMREASIWSIAVNGVMAGCRPEYMPVLIAIVEAIADPHYGLQHAGSTSGWSPLIMLNGPIIGQLGFNYGVGALRPGNQANTSIGRFLRLYMRNVAGFLPGAGDMGTYGGNFFLVLPEAEADSPWPPLSVDRGFKQGDNVVTVSSVISMGSHRVTSGAAASGHLDFLANQLLKVALTTVMTFGPEVSPQIVMTPVIAQLLASEGFAKQDVRQYLFEHARIPAHSFDAERAVNNQGTACEAVKLGQLPQLFCENDNPDRMLPVFHAPDELLIVVSGDATRNRVFATYQAGYQGTATSKQIRLPKNWDQLMAE